VKFHPEEIIAIVDHFEGMRAVAVHETKSIGYAAFRIEKEKLDEVPSTQRTCIDVQQHENT
jgi:hypothetical protein